MISFDTYTPTSKKITERNPKDRAEAEEVERGERCGDGLPTSLQIPLYFSQSRFSPFNQDRFVFAVDVFHSDFTETALFTHCLKELDVVINSKSKIAMISLEAMQAIYAMQKVTPFQYDERGKEMEEQLPITFLDAQIGPVGIQKRSSREEALIVVYNSCYVHLPHGFTYLVKNGRIAESHRRDHLVNGDRIYLVFRQVWEKRIVRSFTTSHGPFAWTAEEGTVYPDIIVCDRALSEGHRVIGLVETVEAGKHIRVKLLLSTIHDAQVIDIPASF